MGRATGNFLPKNWMLYTEGKGNKICNKKLMQIVNDPCALLINHVQVPGLVLALVFMHRWSIICYLVY